MGQKEPPAAMGKHPVAHFQPSTNLSPKQAQGTPSGFVSKLEFDQRCMGLVKSHGPCH